jgi:acyl-CoA synthetase (AMP-forming)/AMP-acid ligase II
LVAFTAEQLAADAENISQTMGLRRDWPNLGCISLAHSYGFSNLVLPLLLQGIPLVLTGSSLPEGVRHAAETGPAFTLAGVPMLWRTWLEAEAIKDSIRLAISAGAPLPLSLEQQVYGKHGLKIHNFYGSSECGAIAYDRLTTPREDSAYVGSAMNNVDLIIAEDGCLAVRSNAVARSYWPEPQPNLANGTFRTSDLVELRSEGVYFRGRATDQINIAGRKVLPEQIEQVLSAYPGVKDCLAFGVPSVDPSRGETIVACVAANSSLTGESLKQYALSHLPGWQVPREWWFVESLGANDRGKLSRAEWRKKYLQRELNGHHR